MGFQRRITDLTPDGDSCSERYKVMGNAQKTEFLGLARVYNTAPHRGFRAQFSTLIAETNVSSIEEVNVTRILMALTYLGSTPRWVLGAEGMIASQGSSQSTILR